MIEFVWEYVVKDDYGGKFELAFGPGGVWSKLLTACPGFRGITLLRDQKNPRRYLMIEVWDSESKRDQMLTEHETGYADLVAAISEWTESKYDVGAFRLMAEATVRPLGKSRRRKTGAARHKNR